MFVVVNFVNEDSVEIVPDTWCLSFNKCLWPKDLSMTQITKMVKDKKDPQKDWETHRVKVLFKTMNYSRAREACLRAEVTSDLSTESDSKLGRGKRKRKKKTIPTESSSSNSDNDKGATIVKKHKQHHDENSKMPIKDKIPTAPLFKPNVTLATVRSDVVETLRNGSEKKDDGISNIQFEVEGSLNNELDLDISTDDGTSISPLKNQPSSFTNSKLSKTAKGGSFEKNDILEKIAFSSKTLRANPIVSTENENNNITHLQQSQSLLNNTDNSISDKRGNYSVVNQNSALQSSSSMSTEISMSCYKVPNRVSGNIQTPQRLSVSTTIPGLIDDISDKRFKKTVISMLCDMNTNLKILMEVVNKSTLGGSNTVILDTSGLPSFPISSVENLKEFDESLCENGTRSKVVNKLASWGAKKVSDATRGILKKLLSHKVSLCCNWNGANGKVALKDMRLKDVIIDAVRVSTNLKVVKELDVENAIKSWLKHAKDRNGGRLKRLLKAHISNTNANESDEELEQRPTFD